MPRTLVPDNLKSAVIKAAFNLSDDIALNRSYREMARHYGCVIDPTPAYSPQKKGKVEAMIRYVKGNFFAPRVFRDIDQAREELVVWNEEIASQRKHATTYRRPRELFEEVERATLLALPASRRGGRAPDNS